MLLSLCLAIAAPLLSSLRQHVPIQILGEIDPVMKIIPGAPGERPFVLLLKEDFTGRPNRLATVPELVVWRDGTVLATTLEESGNIRCWRSGKIGLNEVKELDQSLLDFDITKSRMRESYVPSDSTCQLIGYRVGDVWSEMAWDGTYRYARDVGVTDAETLEAAGAFREFVADWVQIRITLEQVRASADQVRKDGDSVHGIVIGQEYPIIWKERPVRWWRPASSVGGRSG